MMMMMMNLVATMMMNKLNMITRVNMPTCFSFQNCSLGPKRSASVMMRMIIVLIMAMINLMMMMMAIMI